MRERIRMVRIDSGLCRWCLTLYDVGFNNRDGKPAIGWQVSEDGKVVAHDNGSDYVYCSPLHAIDSDASVASCIALIAHDATHDQDDKRIPCDWHADTFAEYGSLRFDDETRREDARKGNPKPKPRYYECGACAAWHALNWNGDCREDAARFTPEALDAKHGRSGWDTAPMPFVD